MKNGIITWETQQTDYPTTGANFPEYEPRGCPRGASYSWYTYSPIRVKYPYIRGDLYELWKRECDHAPNPVQAWENIVTDPEKRKAYVSSRGKGGFVRANWKDVCEMIAAACIYTIKKYGPDRIAGQSDSGHVDGQLFRRNTISVTYWRDDLKFLRLVCRSAISFSTSLGGSNRCP